LGQAFTVGQAGILCIRTQAVEICRNRCTLWPVEPGPRRNRTPYLRHHLRQLRPRFIAASLSFLAEAVVIILLPWPVKFALDDLFLPLFAGRPPGGILSEFFERLLHAIEPSPYFSTPVSQLLGILIFLILTLTLLSAFLRRTSESLRLKVAQIFSERVRLELLNMIVTREQTFIDRRRKLDLIDRLTLDISAIENSVSEKLSVLVRGGTIVALALVVIASIDLRLAAILSLSLPLLYFVTNYFSKRVRLARKRSDAENQHMDHELHQILSSLVPLKSLAVEQESLTALFERSRKYARQVSRAKNSEVSARVLETISKNLLRILILLTGGRSVLLGQLSLGSLALIFIYVDIVQRAIAKLADYQVQARKWSTSFRRIDELFGDLDGHRESEGTQSISSLPFPDATELHFENVSFGFDSGPVLLEGFSADLRPGELITIVGQEHTGKSVFVKLINRLLDPVEGRILLGRTDLRRFRLNLLRHTVTLVSSEFFFMHGTIRANLLLGAGEGFENPSESELAEALRAAACDFLGTLPLGLDTVIGEGGYHLTESQAKRVSLARSFLRRQSRVIIFDEPVKGLEPESAVKIAESIASLAEDGILVLWVTNDPEDILQSDRVLFFERSMRRPHLATHSELLRTSSSYKMYFQQLKASADLQVAQGEFFQGPGPIRI
jgi:ATP-binding cassette subfamily B protein